MRNFHPGRAQDMTTDSMTAEELEAALRAADPRVRFVAARILRRILKQESKLGILGLHLAHRRSLTVATAQAVACVGEEDLGLDPAAPRPGLLLLIETPDCEDLSREAALGLGWRRLFHARVHAEFAQKAAEGRLDTTAWEDRISSLGRLAFAEVRNVLERDDWLMTPEDDASVYEEFAAVYLEFRVFAERLLPATFPGLDDFAKIDALLARDVDASALFEATRPAGASDPVVRAEEPDRNPASVAPPRDEPAPRSESRFKWLLARAGRMRRTGNVVRSAVLRTRAARLAGPSRAGQARSGAEDDLDGLADRLIVALGIDPEDRPRWRPSLSALLQWSDRAVWTVEARLLYDLQKVCIDHEREIFALDLPGWVVSLGRRPIKRALPNQKLVRTAKHLRTATARLRKIRVGDRFRNELTVMIRDATEASEHALRDRFRPLIERSLDRAGLRPANLPERVSFAKMSEELLDRVVDRSFLTMGDVRDAVARSHLKQPDVAGVRDWLRGDRVLQANRRLAVSLDGVYHRGEVYLRVLQSATFLAFGTAVGRWLTLYLALPYGAAFGALVTIQEILGLVEFHEEFVHWWTVLPLGTVALLALHWARFRDLAISGLKGTWRGVRLALFDFPIWVLNRPIVRGLLASSSFDQARRLFLQPFACGLIASGIVYAIDRDPNAAAGIGATIFGLLVAFSITPVGRRVEEFAADASVRAWGRLRADFVPGLIRFVMDVFDRFLEGVERVLYTVDEKLRFRSGQSRLTLAAKAVLAMAWAGVTYLIRIYINLLVEPQINPVKHFPTVTVAAKMILPKLKMFADHIASAVWFLGKVPSNAVAWTTVFFLPGLAGFIVWELKENWRLFEANRPKTLRPVMIGHHGETLRRLVRPGFHSGTIPKLFAKLRRAEGKATRNGDHRSARKALAAIHEVREAIRHFADRELIALLDRCGCLPGRIASVDEVAMTTNRVTIEVAEAGHPSDDLVLAFEDDGRCLVARVARDGWRGQLDNSERRALDAALLGLFALAGAQGVGPESAALAAPESPPEPFPVENDTCPVAEPRVGWGEWVAFWDEPVNPEIEPNSPRDFPNEANPGRAVERVPPVEKI